jgi:hypothetical protein
MSFGNPFSKFPSAVQFPNEKCRWCLTRIGAENRYPVPLCGPCFMMAYTNNGPDSPKGNLWSRLTTEFKAEARALMKRWGKSALTALDAMEATSTAAEEMAELKLHAQRLRLGGDVQMADAMEARLKERMEEISSYRTSMPKLVTDLDREL